MIAKSANRITTAVAQNNGTRTIATPASSFKPIQSPFSSEPATCSPYLISNFQCFISQNPIYPQFQNCSYEMFQNEMSNFGMNANLINGFVSSRISYNHYIINMGYIVVDLSRRLPEDSKTSVSLDISFKIDSPLALDMYCFVEYEKSMTINLLNGQRID